MFFCIKVCISSFIFLSLSPHRNVSLVDGHIKPDSAEAAVEIRRCWPVFSYLGLKLVSSRHSRIRILRVLVLLCLALPSTSFEVYFQSPRET